MTNFEKIKTATPEQIKDLFCNQYGDCLDVCPSFLFERCKEGENGVIEWLNEEAIAPKSSPKDAPKNAPKDAPKDASKGWIKLETMTSTICIDASKIVCLSHAIDTVSGELTAVFTIGSDEPWTVYGNIDEIMEKIKKAYS